MKPHTAGLDETAIPHIKIKITEILLEEKLNTVNPHVPLHNTLRHALFLYKANREEELNK